jgi:hypothetical protein
MFLQCELACSEAVAGLVSPVRVLVFPPVLALRANAVLAVPAVSAEMTFCCAS